MKKNCIYLSCAIVVFGKQWEVKCNQATSHAVIHTVPFFAVRTLESTLLAESMRVWSCSQRKESLAYLTEKKFVKKPGPLAG